MILAGHGLERKCNRRRCQFQASSFLLNVLSLDRMGGECQLEHTDKPLYPNWEDDGCMAWSPSVCAITCPRDSRSTEQANQWDELDCLRMNG
jgi:hypothetical protein